MKSDLKPCPFCGYQVDLLESTPSGPAGIRVYCRGCGAKGRAENSSDDAIKAWNTRYEN